MTTLSVTKKQNGYVVNIEGSIKTNGEYVFKATEILPMLEFVGLNILDKKVRVEER